MDQKIEEFIQETESIILKCETCFAHIDGSYRLNRKLEAEKKFLQTVIAELKKSLLTLIGPWIIKYQCVTKNLNDLNVI